MVVRTVRALGFALALGFVLGCGLGPASVSAGPEAHDEAALRTATTKARQALPEPDEKNGFTYAGDLVVGGILAGSVKLSAEAGSFADKPAWVVAEDVFFDFGGTDWRLGANFTLARDLTLLRAEVHVRAKGVVTTWNLTRAEKVLEGQKQVVRGDVEGPAESVRWDAAGGTTAGYTALALFLRGPLPAEKGFTLAWADPGAWARGETPVVRPLTLEPAGEKTFDAMDGKPETLETRVAGLAAPGSLHVARKGRALVGWSGLLHEKAVVVPEGKQGETARFDEKAPARTWKDAFSKFAIGYHMAREEILAAAFHWETMYEYETSLVDGWPKEKPLAEFKKAWLEAFLSESKHRPRSEADQLLKMTLASGKVETKAEDRILFHAHKNFGGGVQRDYHLRKIGGVWYIVRMDVNE
jgi:hypothetical protein